MFRMPDRERDAAEALREYNPDLRASQARDLYATASNGLVLTRNPLGIKGRNSEPAPLGALGAPLPLKPASVLSPSEITRRIRSLQAGSSAQRCGSWVGGKARLSSTGQGGVAFFGTAASCGSPRCPRCRVSLMARRQSEIQACIDWWLSSPLGLKVSMLTLTAPHSADHSLRRFQGSTKARRGIAGALARLKERALWKRDVVEFISGMETTKGPNGWHLHYHVLVFHVGELDQGEWFRSWAQACRDAGLGRPSRAHGITIQPAESAAAYMAKWGVASEVTGAHVKDAKHGNQTIAALELKAAEGDSGARAELKKYFRAMRGKKVHTFSRGLSPVRLRHGLMARPVQAHYLLDQASSYRLHQEPDFKACILQALDDQLLQPMQIFEGLDLVARVHQAEEEPQLPYQVRRKASWFLKKRAKYRKTEKECLKLIDQKANNMLSVTRPRLRAKISKLLAEHQKSDELYRDVL